MHIENGPTPVDDRRALELLYYTAPNNIDIDAINKICDEISQDGRTAQALLALSLFSHAQAPHLSTVEGMQALGVTLQQLREKEEQE